MPEHPSDDELHRLSEYFKAVKLTEEDAIKLTYYGKNRLKALKDGDE